MKKTVVYAVILSAVSVVLGIVAGVAIERGNTIKHLVQFKQQPSSVEKGAKSLKQHTSQDIFRRVAKELNLNKEQKEKVKQILDEARKKLSLTGDKSREEVKAIRDESNIKIMEILTPQQQEKFKNIITQAQKQYQKLGQRLMRFSQRPDLQRDADESGPGEPPHPGEPPDAALANAPEGAPADMPDAP